MTNWQRLLDLLCEIEFTRRYVALCEKHVETGKHYQDKLSPDLRKTLVAALAETGLKFRWFRGEDFYRYHLADEPKCDIKYHVSTVGSGCLVAALYVQFPGEHILGHNFPSLTTYALQRRAPSAPKIMPGYLFFNGDADALQEVARQATALFIEVRDAIRAEANWVIGPT